MLRKGTERGRGGRREKESNEESLSPHFKRGLGHTTYIEEAGEGIMSGRLVGARGGGAKRLEKQKLFHATKRIEKIREETEKDVEKI